MFPFREKKRPIFLEYVLKLTHEFLYDNFNKKILNFFIKIVIQNWCGKFFAFSRRNSFLLLFQKEAFRIENDNIVLYCTVCLDQKLSDVKMSGYREASNKLNILLSKKWNISFKTYMKIITEIRKKIQGHSRRSFKNVFARIKVWNDWFIIISK